MKKAVTGSKLAFNKAVLTELNDNEIQDVRGGSISLNSIPITIYIVQQLL